VFVEEGTASGREPTRRVRLHCSQVLGTRHTQ
jgi:hypothetical protein